MSQIDTKQRPVMVTISDPDTGETLEQRRLENDYCIIVAGNRFVDHVRVFGSHPRRATHVVTIKTAQPSSDKKRAQ